LTLFWVKKQRGLILVDHFAGPEIFLLVSQALIHESQRLPALLDSNVRLTKSRFVWGT